MTANWIELDGLVNIRDLGGTPTTDGAVIADGQLLRSDNLQTLTESDVAALLDRGITDVVDLRSDLEVEQEGPGPLTREPGVTIHHFSMFKENLTDAETETELTEQINATLSAEEITAQALPWTEIIKPTVEVEDESASFYLSYLVDRPDSVVAALRSIADADGAALVHCAAGKDRTGTIVALALLLCEVDRRLVIEDYARSGERIDKIIAKLAASDTYRDNVLSRPASAQTTRPETMEMFCDYIDREYGSVHKLLATMGWTDQDTAKIRAKLRG
ncbi:tyrosine-protein phosphatase [Microlunatus soli]|uniref:Protein tyrosine/serine phosphatase n=1 Tax=Microlunatus soli TaxID=630515 RepID=A0A1H1UAK7_9ACTN|nr:tyrosine-protein phosphatase [Microlunatus soli]SDS69276.1 Protein tyrosine/serine phosphatase [Microlunatus soli]